MREGKFDNHETKCTYLRIAKLGVKGEFLGPADPIPRFLVPFQNKFTTPVLSRLLYEQEVSL